MSSPIHDRFSKAACPELIAAASELGVTVIENEPLARHTTFRIGGPADLFAVATDLNALEQLAEVAAAHGLPTTILGGGSNILVSDAGVRGLVIANQARSVRCGVSGRALPESQAGGAPAPQVEADSGALLAGLARWTIKNGWSGLEWAVSIPGTVGGAVIGNAGAHGGQIADTLAWASVARPGQGRQLLTPGDLAYGYRSSSLKRPATYLERSEHPQMRTVSPVVLAAAFNLAPGDVAEMTARAEKFLERRRSSQPVEPSAGSVFRNPPGDHAGRLVEAAGLKGYRIGGGPDLSPAREFHRQYGKRHGSRCAGLS